MTRNRLAVVTEHDSDLLNVIRHLDPGVKVFRPEEVHKHDLNEYDSLALLGGGSENPLLLRARDRNKVEDFIALGKRVFAEYVASIGHVYFSPPESTRYDRLVYGSDNIITGLVPGQLIDDQCGMRIKPHAIACKHNKPILQYARVQAHSQTALDDTLFNSISDRALWFDEPENLLVCSFRLSNFVKARFAPKERAKSIVSFILGWLLGEEVQLEFLQPAYISGIRLQEQDLSKGVAAAVKQSLAWFERSGMIYDEGRTGVLEGLGTEIDGWGRQRVSRIRRVDCIGETALPYYLNYLLAGTERDLRISDQLLDAVFADFQIKDQQQWHGMLRWTEEAWGVCYQDDAARAIIPQMLKCLYDENDVHLAECTAALDFLVSTTGTDGTRPSRTDNINLTPGAMAKLRSEPGNFPSAHYNAFYYAALLLAYKLTGKADFLELGRKGMEALMAVYPETKREQSQTQEMCRLILPLSWLYWATGEETHKQWLYRVAEDLQKFKHPSGGYLEWDEGYKAAMRSKMGEGESSLICKNGDPVVDLLYSNNWLPMGFIQAYFVTKDPTFKRLWEEIAQFMLSAQIQSDDPMIHGAWARAFDVELMEVYGSPADMGWGPWAVESGWTVAEISSGLMMGLLENKLIRTYE